MISHKYQYIYQYTSRIEPNDIPSTRQLILDTPALRCQAGTREKRGEKPWRKTWGKRGETQGKPGETWGKHFEAWNFDENLRRRSVFD
jgi:hypothetical protein